MRLYTFFIIIIIAGTAPSFHTGWLLWDVNQYVLIKVPAVLYGNYWARKLQKGHVARAARMLHELRELCSSAFSFDVVRLQTTMHPGCGWHNLILTQFLLRVFLSC